MFQFKRLVFIFLTVLFQVAVGYSYPLTMPENCLQNQKTPCLVKFQKNEKLDYKNINIVAPQESVLNITNFKTMTLGLSHGRLIVDFKKPEASLQIANLIFNDGPMYLERHGNKTIVISGETYARIELIEDHQDKADPKVKTSVMDKIAFIEHLSKYYSKKQDFKTVLRLVFPIYLATHQAEVEHQKKQLQRSIASVEYREEQERLKQADIKAEQKKNRDLFFQRTFKQ